MYNVPKPAHNGSVASHDFIPIPTIIYVGMVFLILMY